MRNKIIERFYIPIYIFIVLIIWELLALLISRFEIFPRFSSVIRDLIFDYQYYLNHLLQTILIIVLGLIPAIIIGYVGAFLVSEYKLLQKIFQPLIKLSQLLPKTALIPIFISISFLGYKLQSKVLITLLISFYPIYSDIYLGLQTIPKEHIKLFKTYRASRFKIISLLKIPFTIVHFLNGLKTAVLYSIIGAVTSEILIARDGLGYVIGFNSGLHN